MFGLGNSPETFQSYIDINSLLPFCVGVSVMFVHSIFSKVWIDTFLERAAHSVDHMLSLYFVYFVILFIPVLVLRAGLGF